MKNKSKKTNVPRSPKIVSYGPMSIIYSFIHISNIYKDNQNLVCKNIFNMISKTMHLRKEKYYEVHGLEYSLSYMNDIYKNKFVDLNYDDNRFIVIAAQNGYIKIMKLLLEDQRVNLRISCKNRVLDTAIICNRPEIVKFLLKDPKVDPDYFIEGIMGHISRTRNSKMLKILLEDGRFGC